MRPRKQSCQTVSSSSRYCLADFFYWGFAGWIAMLMPSRVAGRTLGLLRMGLASGLEVARPWFKLFLKISTVPIFTTCLLSLFHSSTTQLVNQSLPISFLNLNLFKIICLYSNCLLDYEYLIMSPLLKPLTLLLFQLANSHIISLTVGASRLIVAQMYLPRPLFG